MTLIKALCLSLLGYIILKHTNTKLGDINGCCDHDWTPVTCDCGTKLGVSGYDCWQTYHSVDLDPSKVYFKN